MLPVLSDQSRLIYDRIRSLSKAGSDFDVALTRSVHQCAEIGKQVNALAIAAFVSSCDGSPMSRSTSSDGTPISVKRTAKGVLPSGESFTRTGRESHEFLVSHSMYRGRDNSTDKLRTLMAVNDPQPLTYGKSIPAQIEATRLGLRSLRQLGHLGIAIEGYV
jgi:hypothetical protein